MTISIPDKLTSDNSEKYRLSIRLRPGGLSFSVYSPFVGQSLFYKEIDFDSSNSYIESLKEFVFSNDFLSWNFKDIYIVSVSDRYTLLPAEIMDEKQKEKLLFLNFEEKQGRCLNNAIYNEQTEILYDIEDDVYEFCSRSFVNPQFVHYMTSQVDLWKKQSLAKTFNSMYVVVHEKKIDIVCISTEKLLFVNTFDFNQINDIVYYILYVWKQVDFSQSEDYIYIMGELLLCNRIIQLVQDYLNHIERMEIPSEGYLIGGDISRLPFDLISLLI